MKCVSDPSEKGYVRLGSERQNLENDWPKVLILPEVPPKNFFLLPEEIKMQPAAQRYREEGSESEPKGTLS